MRMLTGGRNDGNIETHDRLFKFDYRSLSSYSIEIWILQKRLMHNLVIRNGEHTLHNKLDLE